ncbi:hypothetical protein FPOAC2_13952 [Fusarium poae]
MIEQDWPGGSSDEKDNTLTEESSDISYDEVELKQLKKTFKSKRKLNEIVGDNACEKGKNEINRNKKGNRTRNSKNKYRRRRGDNADGEEGEKRKTGKDKTRLRPKSRNRGKRRE